MKLKNKFFSMLFFSSIIGSSMIAIPLMNSEKSINNVSQTLNSKSINNNPKSLENTEDISIIATWGYEEVGSTSTTTPTLETIDKWEHYGKLKPEEVTGEHIKSLLNFSVRNPVVTIEIMSTNSVTGVVEFQIKQLKNVYQNGEITSTKEHIVTAPSGSEGTSSSNTTDSNIWSTKKFKNLFIQDKYNFAWRSDEEIAQFLKHANENYSFDTLTDELIILNLFKQGDGFKLPSNDKISITKEGLNSSNSTLDKEYGAMKIKVTFNTDDNNEWLNNTKPDNIEKTIRGLKSTSDKSTTMDLITISSSELSSLEVDKQNYSFFNKYLLSNENTLRSLYPSELVNLNAENDDDALLNLFTNGKYLKNNENAPPIKLSYYGKNISDTDFQTVTNLSQNIIDQINFTSVKGIANDSEGSLTLIIDYTYYDVFTDKIVEDTKTINYEAGTFEKNPDEGKVLSFEWKTDETLVSVTSSYEIVNSFNNIESSGLSEKEKRINKVALSNQFFNGSNDAYEKGLPGNDDSDFEDIRDVTISYGSGTVRTPSGESLPKVKSDQNVTIDLHFKSWNGLSTNGQNGFKTSKTFKLKSYQNEISNVIWKKEQDVIQSIKQKYNENPETISVNTIADDLYNGKLDIGIFASGISGNSYKVVFSTNPLIGSITITVEDGTKVSSQVFSPFKKESLNQVTQFSWLSENEVSKKLLSTNLKDVTKRLVIDEYLTKIDMFKDGINESLVTLQPDYNNKTLKVTVDIQKFDQNISTGSKNFSVEIRGFVTNSIVDANSYKAPKDLTLLLSVIFAVLVIAIMGGVLGWLATKSLRLKKIEKTKGY